MFFYSYILKRYYNEPKLIKTKDETEIENILFRNCFNFQEREFMIVLKMKCINAVMFILVHVVRKIKTR